MKAKNHKIRCCAILEEANTRLFAANLHHAIQLMVRLAQDNRSTSRMDDLADRVHRLEKRQVFGQ